MLIRKDGLNLEKKKRSINLNGELIWLNEPVVMGILNVTPDSFFDGGKYQNEDAVLKRAEQIVEEGGKIIDIGAYSTRPGANDVSAKEEIDRLLPAVKLIRDRFPQVGISIDTFRAEVVQEIVKEAGLCMVNDISGGTMDEKMFETIAQLKVPYVLMHIQGTPQTMQEQPQYDDVARDVIRDLAAKVNHLHRLGISDVIIDPGFGFGKTLDHNYELLNRLDAFEEFRLPLLVGVSRKSMIFRLLGITPQESLSGTTALNMLALQAGADILRVHDVKEAVETVKIYEKLKSTLK
ncbi:dihydropteroate synthase [Prolixibacteraceae bacterium JC049]|nr:dihydropteroate synthase [Prolixibacteraceae bacterium JC049]